MTLSLFTAPETIWLPIVDTEDSDSEAPTSPTQESLGYSAETHSGSVDYKRHVMLCVTIELSGQGCCLPRPHFWRQRGENHVVTVACYISFGSLEAWLWSLFFCWVLLPLLSYLFWVVSLAFDSWAISPAYIKLFISYSSVGKCLSPEVLRCYC